MTALTLVALCLLAARAFDPINDTIDALPLVEDLFPENESVDPAPAPKEEVDANEDLKKMIEIYQEKVKTLEDYSMDDSYGSTWSLPTMEDVNTFASRADFEGTSGKINAWMKLVHYNQKVDYVKLFAEVYDGEYRDRYVSFLVHISPDQDHFEYDESNPLHYKAKNVSLEIRPGSF